MKNKILNVNPGRKLAHFKHADNNPLHNLNLNIKKSKETISYSSATDCSDAEADAYHRYRKILKVRGLKI